MNKISGRFGGQVMKRSSKAMMFSGAAALAVAVLGAVLFMTQPSQSKDDKKDSNITGVSTTLGF
jgi:hypothetical protein